MSEISAFCYGYDAAWEGSNKADASTDGDSVNLQSGEVLACTLAIQNSEADLKEEREEAMDSYG
jgi:hypothetical protein